MFSLGHLECSFDNFVERFLRKSRNFFSQCPRLIKKGRKNQKNPSKLSKGHVEGDLENPTLKNRNKRQKLLRSMSKIEMKKSFLRISVFLGNVRMDSSFGSPAENFWQLPKNFPSTTASFEKLHFAGKKFFFLEMFLWTGRMQFWQPRRNFSGKRHKFFHSKSKNDGKLVFFRKKVLKLF